MTDYPTRLAQALALCDSAGLSRASSFPPFLRALSALGLPVRPLHFMSTFGLVLFLATGLGLIIYAGHWLALQVEGNHRLIGRLQNLGVAGSVAIGLVIGLLTAIVIRFQALQADLPAWRDL
jgi:predicted histidine transporter YuiF (NhaC family)